MFLQRWTAITDSLYNRTYLTSPLPSLFTSAVYQAARENTPEQASWLTEINAPVSRDRSDAGTSSIIDALEDTIWRGEYPACIRSFSDVLLVRLKRDDHEGGAGVEILPRMSLARFAWAYYGRMEKDLAVRRVVRDTLDKLRRRREEGEWIEKGGKKFSATSILEATIEYMKEVEGKTALDETEDDDGDSSMMDIDSAKTLPALSAHLEASLELLKQSAQGILVQCCADEDIETSIENMERQLTTLFNFPSTISRRSSLDREDTTPLPPPISLVYTLRGVIIDHHLTFFSQWEHYSNPYTRKLAWFKADFTSNPEITSVEEGEVLTIARERGDSGIITVYVKDDVTELVKKALPPDYLRVPIPSIDAPPAKSHADNRNSFKETTNCFNEN